MLEAGGPLLSHLVVPGAENSDGVDPQGAAHPVALPKRARHAGRSRARWQVVRGTEARGGQPKPTTQRSPQHGIGLLLWAASHSRSALSSTVPTSYLWLGGSGSTPHRCGQPAASHPNMTAEDAGSPQDLCTVCPDSKALSLLLPAQDYFTSGKPAWLLQRSLTPGQTTLDSRMFPASSLPCLLP